MLTYMMNLFPSLIVTYIQISAVFQQDFSNHRIPALLDVVVQGSQSSQILAVWRRSETKQ